MEGLQVTGQIPIFERDRSRRGPQQISDPSRAGGRLLRTDQSLYVITLGDRQVQGERTRTRRYLKPELGVLAVVAAGVLCAFCCVVDTLPGSGANSVIG